MASRTPGLLHCLPILLLLPQLARSAIIPPSGPSDRQHEPNPQPSNAYIVHTDHLAKPSQFATPEHWYTSMVATLSLATTSERIFYVYDTVMHGFAAELKDAEARLLSNTPGVAGVYKDTLVHLHTTRSPGFLGLNKGFGIWPDTDFGDGVIIGFVDTGIWPESASFNDSGLGPVRPSWKGRCDDGERFNASMFNNKLVGARVFTAGTRRKALTGRSDVDDFKSPRDKSGTAHTWRRRPPAPRCQTFMFATGTARGVAPRARVAMYKACDLHDGCHNSGIVAAIDAAVKDGVDILSLTLGGIKDPDFYKDPMSIALFGAVRAGVFVACLASNFGPRESTLSNVAPWITTVGAATVDRVFPVSITLGNGQILTGQSLYAHTANRTEMIRLLPSNCTDEELVPDRIMGKIVVCTVVGTSKGAAVQRGGGSGLVSLDTMDWRMDGLMVEAFTLPAVSLSAVEAEKLSAYIHSEPYPMASFCFTCRTVTGENRAPMVASFSSRGPNHIVRKILKPDVIAQGTNILAAWPDESPLTHSKGDARRSSFNIISGTSMSCPHVAGVAALLKQKNHDWTPATILSALMTTATTLDSHGRPIEDNARRGGSATPMAARAGLVRPQQALDPGLVYDAVEQDYVDFLCTLNYTAAQIRMFVPVFAGCTRTLPGGVGSLNYPSFVVDFSNGTDVRVLTRTVTKVSEGHETYTVKVVTPDQLVAVTVTPATLEFGKQNETKSYTVVFRSKSSSAGVHGAARMTQFGHIVLENDVHRLRSPVVFMWS